jgi:hypothetical protein
MKDLLDKLERVERTINIYTNDSEKLVKEIDINIPVERLKSVLIPEDGDNQLYRDYLLDRKQLDELNNDLGGIIKPDFDLYYYVLECHGIYNW